MTKNFEIDFDGVMFEFLTMNRVRLDAYQVYVLNEGKKQRFHMQIADDGFFYITDKASCPEIYHHLEKTLSDAIISLGKQMNLNVKP